MYLNDHEKTNFIEFDVKPGYLLYIPSYWWYSITYLDDPSTYICSITYNTFINYVSNSWDLSIYFLQQQNIKQKPPKNINYEEVLVNNKEKEETHTTDTTPISELNEKNTVDTNIKTEEIKENEEIKEEDIIDISSNLTEIKKLPEKENNITYTISSI
tara:strand:- start:167 stop:640 length:474 start_codon:yes stop_codon:yes gene_type:complete